MRYTFQLAIPAHEFGRYYRGKSNQIRVRSDQGHILRFAARHLRPYLKTDGIYGHFELLTDEKNHFDSLKKLDKI